MKLVNVDYQLKIEFDENRLETLVLESPLHYADVVFQLSQQFQGNAGAFVLSDDDKALNFGKAAEMVIDPFHIDLNNRRFLNRLYAELGETAEKSLVEKDEINAKMIQILDEILGKTAYTGIVYDLEIGWEKIFQMYGVRLDDEFETLAERMIEYIKIMADLFETRLFIFVGLHAFLTVDDIRHVFQIARYKKVGLLLLESKEYESLPEERIHIIDSDRCLIVKDTDNASM